MKFIKVMLLLAILPFAVLIPAIASSDPPSPPAIAASALPSTAAQQIDVAAAEDRETHARADAIIAKWTLWHTDRLKDADGGNKVSLWVRDKTITADVLLEAYSLPSGESGDYLKGPHGAHAIPQFSFVYGSNSFKAAIFDINFDQFYKFNIDGSIDIRFTFHMKDGKISERYLPAYLGNGGQPVFLKDESLAILDFIMMSDSMDVTVPGYDIDHSYTFDCASFSAKGLINLQE
jgi:hypothetical protein